MNIRLAQIIEYKTAGRKSEFAELCGWTPQYLTKLLNGENFGLTPVLAIINAVPEIDARWLLTGSGEMLDKRDALIREQNSALDFVRAALDLEQFVPVMDEEQKRRFVAAVNSQSLPHFEPSERDELEKRLLTYREDLDAKFAVFCNNQSKTICRRKTRKQ